MKVSIIIPVYNTGKYLAKCLSSCINQTLKEIEIIVINDGSTDNSLSIINKFMEAYPKRIKFINNANSGVGAARNFGIDIANGEYLWFLDSDDWLNIDALEKMYNLAKENNVDFIRCDLGRRIGELKIPKNNNMKSKVIFLDKEKDFIVNEKPGPGNKMFKRKLVDDLRFPRNKKWEDLAFCPVLVADNNKIFYLAEEKMNYRMGLHNTTTKDLFNPNDRILEIFDILVILEQNFKDRQIYEKYEQQLYKIAVINVLRRVADVISWRGFSYDNKIIIINSLINLLEIKYNSFDVSIIRDTANFFNPLAEYNLLRINNEMLDTSMRQETDENIIRKNVIKVLKNR